MNNERVEYLLSYLHELQGLNSEGYACHREISECIKWIRQELVIDSEELSRQYTSEELSENIDKLAARLLKGGDTND